MKAEWERLVQSLEAFITAPEEAEAERLEAIYQSRIDDTLLLHPRVSRDQLLRLADFTHRAGSKQTKSFLRCLPKRDARGGGALRSRVITRQGVRGGRQHRLPPQSKVQNSNVTSLNLLVISSRTRFSSA